MLPGRPGGLSGQIRGGLPRKEGFRMNEVSACVTGRVGGGEHVVGGT